jgi:hypothetical protein
MLSFNLSNILRNIILRFNIIPKFGAIYVHQTTDKNVRLLCRFWQQNELNKVELKSFFGVRNTYIALETSMKKCVELAALRFLKICKVSTQRKKVLRKLYTKAEFGFENRH